MKTTLSIVIIALLFNTKSYSQFGFGFGVSFKGFINMEISYGNKNDRYSFGLGFKSHKNLLKTVTEILPNYGRTLLNRGTTKAIYYGGYKHYFNKIFAGASLGVGHEDDFLSYKDDRFKDGGYSVYGNSELILDIGLEGGYVIEKYYHISVGLFSQQGVKLGFTYSF